eukprot:CCRYP_000836-RA/>CCRYP_000836-RA protein AED:0.40 eAED:0.12 QI:0/0/0/0.5/1/1/6/0/1669
MLTKLVKDEDAKFKPQDVHAFLEGMYLFESKAELLTLLEDDRNFGTKRIHDCLSMISGPGSVDTIVAPLLMNIINEETGRPLYKAPRDNVVRAVFATPGFVEFLAATWCTHIDQSSPKTIESIAQFLFVASMASVEARNSSHVKIIASALREKSQVESQIVRRLCAIIQLDALDSGKFQNLASKVDEQVLCWGSDLHPPGGRHDNDHSNFRDISLVPTQEELGFEGRPWLPLSNEANALVADVEEGLLDRNFRLLREDAVGTMRDNIANPRASKIWKNARIIGASCNDAFHPERTSCLYFLVQFDLPKGRTFDWNVRRALPRDALVALQKDDEALMMATVFVRAVKKNHWLDSPGGPVIGLVFHHTSDVSRALVDVCVNLSISQDYEKRAEMLRNTTDPNIRVRIEEEMLLLKRGFVCYTMTEASDSFFSYSPVLEALKEMTSVPLAEDIVSLTPTGERPSYMPRHVYMPSDFGGLECDLDAWQNDHVVESTSLDKSQATALNQALSSRVALIQGPPGTGKTFIGGLVAQMIRDNSDESILCVCYTNHALDQFLHHMLKRGEKHLVRIGGRTKSQELKRYELRELARTKERSTSDAEHRMKVVVAKLHKCNRDMAGYLETMKEPLEWSALEELFYRIEGNLYVNFPNPGSDGFQVVGKGNRRVDSEAVFAMWKDGDRCPFWLEEMLGYSDTTDFENVWLLSPEHRLRKLDEWKQQHMKENIDALQETARHYQLLSSEKEVISMEIESRILNDARIIGATTTGAAKYRDLLRIKSAGVVIVEEAGEVLEPHIISALSEPTVNTKETKHLILIGDHKQLRPKVESYRLTKVSGHGYDFDVSLFERMILAGYPSAMLQVQHRMRPCISALIREQTYPTLQDHTSVHQYPNVKGVTDNLLFIDHDNPEEGADDHEATTKSNVLEASYCMEMIRYLLLQGYKHHQITVLTPYVGQILRVLCELRKLGDVHAYISELDRMDLLEVDEDVSVHEINDHDDNKSIRCASIDNFQGEESDIVVVSLVRSNKQGSIGFLKEEQRVNVLLSRAKHGMFIVGNASTLQASPKGQHVWQPLLRMLQDQGRLVNALPTVCQIHPNDIVLCKEATDFKKYRPNGGCMRACGARLDCGHACPLTCHPTDLNHALAIKQCVQPCRRIPTECPHNHSCQKLCNENCGPCATKVEDVKLLCGHLAVSPTCDSVRNDDAIRQLSSQCKEMVEFTFAGCNHTCMTTCGNSQSEHPICNAKCRGDLKIFCFFLFQGVVPVKKAMHASKDVSERCSVGICVGERAMAVKNVVNAKISVFVLLVLKHVIGSATIKESAMYQEKKTRQVDVIEFTEYQDLDLDNDPIIFLPCGHFFSMSTLDGWIHLNTAYKQNNVGEYIGVENLGNIVSEPKSCPDCRSVIHSVKRYGRLTAFHCLRSFERKHMMKVDIKLSLLSSSFERAGLNHKALEKLLVRLEALEAEIALSPMLKVFQACGGAGVDAPTPPIAHYIESLRLKGAVYGKLVEQSGDKAYTTAMDTYTQAIKVAHDTQCKKQSAKLILEKSQLVLQWSELSESIKRQIVDDMVWIVANLKNIDETSVSEARKLHDYALNRENEIKEVVMAMNVIGKYNYGGSWSDHWFECPNGHPYFIGECGGAMVQSNCIECGAPVGGSSHTLLGTNRRAGGAVAAALRH